MYTAATVHGDLAQNEINSTCTYNYVHYYKGTRIPNPTVCVLQTGSGFLWKSYRIVPQNLNYLEAPIQHEVFLLQFR